MTKPSGKSVFVALAAALALSIGGGILAPATAWAGGAVVDNASINASAHTDIYAGTVANGSETVTYVYCPWTLDPTTDLSSLNASDVPGVYANLYQAIYGDLSPAYAALLPEPGYQSTTMDGFLAYDTGSGPTVLDAQEGAAAIAALGVDWTNITAVAAHFYPGTTAGSPVAATSSQSYSVSGGASVTYQYIDGVLTPVTTQIWVGVKADFTDQTLTTTGSPIPPSCDRFTDVPASNVYAPYICWLASTGVTSGTSPTTYSPAAPVERQQMAVFLYKLAGSPSFTAPTKPTFTDVPASSDYYPFVEWLRSTGITSGTSPTTFSPAAGVTREQMAVFLYELAGSPSFTAPVTPSFTDVPTSSDYYRFVEWLKSTGITSGTSPTTFTPEAGVTRDQMAVFMYKLATLHLYCGTYTTGILCNP